MKVSIFAIQYIPHNHLYHVKIPWYRAQHSKPLPLAYAEHSLFRCIVSIAALEKSAGDALKDFLNDWNTRVAQDESFDLKCLDSTDRDWLSCCLDGMVMTSFTARYTDNQ